MRDSIIKEIELLAHPSLQLQYEKEVPQANVPGELICGFCDDLYHPKSPQFLDQFSESELKDLSHLYGVMCEAAKLEAASVQELLLNPKWRAVVSVAKELHAYYGKNT